MIIYICSAGNVSNVFTGGTVVKNPPVDAGETGDVGSIPRLGRILGERNSNPVFLPGKLNGHRSLVGYSPWGHKESVMTEHAHLT